MIVVYEKIKLKVIKLFQIILNQFLQSRHQISIRNAHNKLLFSLTQRVANKVSGVSKDFHLPIKVKNENIQLIVNEQKIHQNSGSKANGSDSRQETANWFLHCVKHSMLLFYRST